MTLILDGFLPTLILDWFLTTWILEQVLTVGYKDNFSIPTFFESFFDLGSFRLPSKSYIFLDVKSRLN